MFPETIVINVTQNDLDNGGRRGERPDAIHLAIKRDYPQFDPHICEPNGWIRLTESNESEMGWYRINRECVSLINEIDVTNGHPYPQVIKLQRSNPTKEAHNEYLKYWSE